MGRKTVQHKEWITPTISQKIRIRKDKWAALNHSQRRAGKAAAQKECCDANTELKRSMRADMRGHTDNLARQAEEATAQRNIKGLYMYNITGKLAGRYQQTNKPAKGKQRMPQTKVQEHLSRWTEHSPVQPAPEDPLPPPPLKPDISPAETPLPNNIEKPS